MDFKKLNLVEPEKFVKATDHISEQIDLVRKLEEKGLTYKTSDGIYFSVGRFVKFQYRGLLQSRDSFLNIASLFLSAS